MKHDATPALASLIRALAGRWTWQMAWRDSRRSRRRLVLYSTSIVLGVAALIAVGSLGANLAQSIELQAKALLGADLVLASRDEMSPEANSFIQSLGGIQAREVSFSSMVYFPKSEHTRLVQIRALEGDFPFYGVLETNPKSAANEFRKGSGALVEDSLIQQFGVNVGDRIKVGGTLFPVLGSLQKVPGETVAFATIAPRVYIPLADLPKTGLMGKGSLVRHRVYFKFGPEFSVTELLKRTRPQREKFHLEADTVEHRKQDLGRAMTNLDHFLNLVGFVALLLGGIGIASAIHVHIKDKLSTVAILRALGCGSAQAFGVYLVQAIALGLFGVTAGIALGLVVQLSLPAVLRDFIPFPLSTSISIAALARGAIVGFAICFLFALLPLLRVRRVSPLGVLRVSVERNAGMHRDPLVWLCYGVIAAGLLAFSISQSQRWRIGVAFAAGLGLAFAALAGLAQGTVALLRRPIGKLRSFTWRQGMANLYRPNNRTVLLLLSLGLGTFLILTLYLVQRNLVGQVFPSDQGARPDAVLFDVQSDQKEALVKLLESEHLPVLQQVPVVTMRLASVKGRSVEMMRRDLSRAVPNWALRREYRSTYRSALVDSEKLVAGVWHERVSAGTSPIPVSLEDGIAKTLQVHLGDPLEFDVQGVPVKTVVASLREVDWRRLQPNFFVVFPLGVLEDAPAFHVLVTRVGSSEKSAQMQRLVARQFPNVSVVDLTLVLQTLDSVLRKVSFVLRFMALFTVGTGLVVVVASILSGRFQRLQESILLRTLGASRRQILQISMVEYFSLGALAACTGIAMAASASWALAHFLFKIDFHLPAWPLVATLLLVSGVTVLTGFLVSLGIGNRPPLEVLRSEA